MSTLTASMFIEANSLIVCLRDNLLSLFTSLLVSNVTDFTKKKKWGGWGHRSKVFSGWRKVRSNVMNKMDLCFGFISSNISL